MVTVNGVDLGKEDDGKGESESEAAGRRGPIDHPTR
jgi:hypothetical protein